MTKKEFDKAPLLEQILYDETGMLVKNHPSIAAAMKKYHQAKLKLLEISVVSTRLTKMIANLDNKIMNTTYDNLEHLAWDKDDIRCIQRTLQLLNE